MVLASQKFFIYPPIFGSKTHNFIIFVADKILRICFFFQGYLSKIIVINNFFYIKSNFTKCKTTLTRYNEYVYVTKSKNKTKGN